MQPSAARCNADRPAPIDSLAGDVQYYLTQTPRQLPSRYFYDALGSALFEAICELPWYRITSAERGLLDRHGREIIAAANPVTLVELGPGNGDKLGALVRARGSRASLDWARDRQQLAVHLVDVSAAALDHASRTIAAVDPDLAIVLHETTYEDGLVRAAAQSAPSGRALVLFLGSNIGNFDRPGADEFLIGVRAALSPGDMLLIGADLVKPESDLLLAYDDPLGVTAAFNRNLLVRINRELGADFDVAAFRHRALWNAAESRVEMHLVSTRAQQVRIPGASLDVAFEEGETIWTESSYKYRPDRIAQTLERAGFKLVEQWIDDVDRFALTLVEATSLPATAG